MNYTETMAELKKAGTTQNVKIYRRHGAVGDMFGVSFANLGKLKKKIKVDHDLALKLWDSGNMDARVLAVMVAEPDKLSSSTADSWVKELDYYIIADLFAGLVARTGFAENKMNKWMKSKKEFVRQCGYSILASALKNGNVISDAQCEKILSVVEKEIHASPNRARYSMNTSLIAIGVYKPNLTKKATDTAGRIGKVEVDHGDTSCKTPDAAAYIKKTLQHYKRKKTR